MKGKEAGPERRNRVTRRSTKIGLKRSYVP